MGAGTGTTAFNVISGAVMKKSRFTETQIVSILKLADAGMTVK
jgi:hypothetical protein